MVGREALFDGLDTLFWLGRTWGGLEARLEAPVQMFWLWSDTSGENEVMRRNACWLFVRLGASGDTMGRQIGQ